MHTLPNSFFTMQKALNDDQSAPLSKFAKRLRTYDLQLTVAAIGGLQLLPEFQASTYRIEELAHAAVATCNEGRAPRRGDLAAWLTDLGSIGGSAEDPAEDVFSGRVIFEGKNYTVLEGLSEAGCFHLQLILYVVEGMPEAYPSLKDECRAALVLADAICTRAGIVPYELGAEFPLRGKVTDGMLRPVRELTSWVTFSREDLQGIGLSPEALLRFLLAPDERDVLSKRYGTSELFTKPLLLIEGSLIVALPTAIGHAIRSLVIDTCIEMGPRNASALRIAHLQAICEQLFESSTFSRIPFAPIGLSLSPVISTEPAEIEPGYWLQMVLVVDNLEQFQNDGLMGTAQNGQKVEELLHQKISQAQADCAAQPGFKAGLSIVITCGFGRGLEIGIRVPDSNWFVESTSDYDAIVLSWRTDLELADILRLAMTEHDLKLLGFEIPRMNSLLGKVADAVANRGHLIPHEVLEDGMQGGMVLLPQNSQLKTRHQFHLRNDIRAITAPDGSIVKIRKVSDGARSPNQICRLYASMSEARSGRLRAVWVHSQRNWWIETKPLSSNGQRPCFRSFMALEVWIQRVAIILDASFPELSDLMLWELHIDP